jgi:ribosome-associated heat shock protein Hsp15
LYRVNTSKPNFPAVTTPANKQILRHLPEIESSPAIGFIWVPFALKLALNWLFRPIPTQCFLRPRTPIKTMDRIRIDKYLWAARFFKTRSLAAHACELGRVESNGQPAKPAREVRIGDTLRIKNEGGEFTVEVLALSEIRGPAATAQTLYRETEASRAARAKLAEDRKLLPHFEQAREGKPSKRDRRLIHRFRDPE